MGYENKPCAFCGKDKDGLSRGRKYHAECQVLVRAEAQRNRRVCSRCRKLLAASAFTNDLSRANGKFPWCHRCQALSSDVDQNPANKPNGYSCKLCLIPVTGHANRRFCSVYCKNRTGSLRKRFNLSPEQYRTLLKACDGRCPICLSRVKKWVVDHNHETGEVTGICCTKCNVGLLAYSDHSVERAQRFAAYLENPPARALLGGVFVPPGVHERESQLHTVWRGRKPKRRRIARKV
jgi:Recombination endonuclease VII